ncbi:MAG TPA: spermidine/putrescine ABC transporter substrate-binding protein [Gaiellaceae bacterium]|nr:spermidine/putrescine ABC transporter substrate-binding protein [Gaiellaceae bacterium]
MSDEPLFERRVDRKGFMAVSALAALAAAGGGRLTRDALAAAGEAEQAGGVLHYYNWAAYVNPKTYADFTKATGIRVKKSFYVSNEALLAKLKAGARGYDLAVPTGYMVNILAQEKLLERIDWAKLPNVRKNLDPKFKGLPFDRKDEWSVPKDWGTTGFVYRTDLIKDRPRTWKQFFALFRKYPKRFTLLDGSPEVIGSVLVMLGHSYNSDSASELEQARRFLLELKPYVHSLDSVTYKQKIIGGKAYGGMAWNGDGAVVASKKPAEYVVASEGGEFWVDSYVIPVGAENPDAAHRWIDFVYQPRVNAQETSFTYYGSPLKRSTLRGVLARSILGNPDVFPPPNLVAKLEANNVSARGTRLRERIWTEFKSA